MVARWAYIAFDSLTEGGHADIWTISTDGSGLRRVTDHAADEFTPSFSRDSRFIYFVSNRTGSNEVWRVVIATGAEDQLTRNGATAPFESLDGRTLYYSHPGGALLARSTAGGIERTIRPCTGAWAVATKGLVFEDCGSPDAPDRLVRFWDEATDQDRIIGSLSTDWIGGLSPSPDGRRIIFGRLKATSDLMMIDGFR